MAVTLSVPLFAVTAVENFSNGFNARGTRGYNRGYQLYLILDWDFECTVVKFIVSSRNIVKSVYSLIQATCNPF